MTSIRTKDAYLYSSNFLLFGNFIVLLAVLKLFRGHFAETLRP